MFKQTKNFILFAAFLSLGFISCKKSSSNTDIAIGTISVSIDGVATTFNYLAKADVPSVTGGYGVRIQGYKKDPSLSATSLTFSVVRPTAITTGTYVENAGSNPFVEMSYFYDLVLGTGTTSVAYGSTTSPVTITITDINTSSVKGTFSGELLSPGISGPFKNLLVNGKFYVRF